MPRLENTGLENTGLENTGAVITNSSICALSILVIDDVDRNRELLDVLLSAAGHKVTKAASGEEGLSLLHKRQDFDLILMDVQMPGLDGLEVTRRIRSMQGASAIPVVAVTANVTVDQRQACLAAGMDEHLAKPIDLDALFALLHQACRPQEQEDLSMPGTDAADPLAALRISYSEHMKTFAGEYSRLQASDPQHRDEAIVAYTHSIAGTAGTLGFGEVSQAAFALISAIDSRLAIGDDDKGLQPLIDDLIGAAARQCDRLDGFGQ